MRVVGCQLCLVLAVCYAATPLVGEQAVVSASQPYDVVPSPPTPLEIMQGRYRVIRSVRSDKLRTQKMKSLSQELADQIRLVELEVPTGARLQLADWQKLLMCACAWAGDPVGAEAAAQGRLRLMIAASLEPSTLARQLLDDAASFAADKQFALAEWSCDAALRLSTDTAVRFRAAFVEGRIVSDRDGLTCAVEYYDELVKHNCEAFPELAQEAAFRAAEEYFRAGDLDQAVFCMTAVEERFAGEPIEERARHAKRGWMEIAFAKQVAQDASPDGDARNPRQSREGVGR